MPFARLAADLLYAQIYTVRGSSMSPTVSPGDRLLVSRRTYRGVCPARGDLVIIHDPGNPGRCSLKRIVGLPREAVRLAEGTLFIDGRHVVEPYLGGLPASPGLAENLWELGDRDYFAMGDNRAHSTDSRDFGPIDLGQIVGRVGFRCWPPGRWGVIGA